MCWLIVLATPYALSRQSKQGDHIAPTRMRFLILLPDSSQGHAGQ